MPGDGLAHSGSRLPLGHTGAEEQLETGALLPERRTQAISCADRPHTGRPFKCNAHLLPPLTAWEWVSLFSFYRRRIRGSKR